MDQSRRHRVGKTMKTAQTPLDWNDAHGECDYSLLLDFEDEEFLESPEIPQPQRQEKKENPKPKICPEKQTSGLKPLSFAQVISFRPATVFAVKPVSVPASTQPVEIKQSTTALDKPTSTSESTSVVNVEALQVENTALKGQLQHLKQLLQQKDQMLEDAALKVDHFEERMNHEKGLSAKAKTSLSHLREEKQQWQEEKSSILQELSQLKDALQQKEVLAENVNMLEKERKEWETQSSSLVQEITQLKTAHQDKETMMTDSKKLFNEKLAQLHHQLDELKNQQQQQHLDYSSKISQLETSLKLQTIRADDAESLAAQKVQQYDCAQAAMVHLGRAFQKKMKDMEMEKELSLQEMAQLKTAQEKQQQEEELDLTSKISKLETSVKEETFRADDAERRLVQQKQETASAHASIVTLRVALQKQSQELEMQRSHYLHHHQLVLTEAQKQLAKERDEWQRKNSSLNQEMAELRRVHEEGMAATNKAEKTLLELLCNIEKSVDTLKETVKEKDRIIKNSETIWKEKLDQQEKHLEEVKKAYHKKNFDLGQQLHQMEEQVKEERIQTNHAKLSFDLEVEESTKLRAALAQVQKELDEQKQQRLKDKSSLSQEIDHLKEVIKKKETSISDLEEAFTVQLDHIQQQVEELKQKPQKKTAGQKFLNIFRKSRKKV